MRSVDKRSTLFSKVCHIIGVNTYNITGDILLLSELESKDIINDHDGAKIGRIVDAEIDVATGRILNIRLQLGFRLLNIFFFKRHSDHSLE